MSKKDRIYSTGYSGGITIFWWSGTGSVGIVVDSKGNITMQYSKGWNVNSPDFNVSIQKYTQNFKAPNYSFLAGESSQIGGAGSISIVGVSIKRNEAEVNGKKYQGETISSGFSFGMAPVGGYAGMK